MQSTATLAKKAGILNLMHSNGFINEAPLKELCKVIDGVNIDLKGFNENFYEKFCKGGLAPVLETLKILKNARIHQNVMCKR